MKKRVWEENFKMRRMDGLEKIMMAALVRHFIVRVIVPVLFVGGIGCAISYKIGYEKAKKEVIQPTPTVNYQGQGSYEVVDGKIRLKK